jgi:hypothetical protein
MNTGCAAVAALAIAVAGLSSGAAAQEARLDCGVSTSSLGDAIRQLPEATLKQLFVRCALASERRRLDSEEMVACSVANDVLLKGTFANDFDAMLAWSKRQLASAREQARSPD